LFELRTRFYVSITGFLELIIFLLELSNTIISIRYKALVEEGKRDTSTREESEEKRKGERHRKRLRKFPGIIEKIKKIPPEGWDKG
jgi:hypothetical protein